jgi:hypothetical protein
MEDVLKGLTGKSLTKKKLFDFLADIDFERLLGKKDGEEVNRVVEKVVEKDITKKEVKPKEDIKCTACLKTFTVDSSLRRHYNRSPACVNWNSQTEKKDLPDLSKGLHLIINDILGNAVGDNGNLKCRWCNTTFTNVGNHHKHYNTASVCNKLAFQEFVRIINNYKT